MTKCFFVTGTDTEVGKTVASSALLQAANQLGFNTAGYKPVASGSDLTAQGLRNEDALALQRNSWWRCAMNRLTLILLPSRPRRILLAPMKGDRLPRRRFPAVYANWSAADWVLVEGAGGWFTPLSETLTFADWAQQEQLPVILVVGVKLGCINHAMLTAGGTRSRAAARGLDRQRYPATG